MSSTPRCCCGATPIGPLMVRRLGQRANYFHAATAIANVAGIFYLTRALDFAKMPDVIAWLERIGCDLRLTEKAA